MTELILSKARMYRLLREGKFGNTFRWWETWPALVSEGYRGLVSVRCKQIANPIALYDVPFEDVNARIKRRELPPGCVFYEATPRSTRRIQGELIDLPGGVFLKYTFIKLPMRLAFQEHFSAVTGAAAHLILRRFVQPCDFEHLFYLLETFPNAAIEFSTFSVPVGVLNQRMVIWEVRHY